MVKLRPYNIDSGIYAGILIKLYLKKAWWAYAIPAIALVIAGVGDMRFMLLALIYVFLVIPMIMAFAFTFYGLIKESRYSILRHRMLADEQGMEFFFIDENGCDIEHHKMLWKYVRHIHPQRENMVLTLKTGRFKFIVIPYTAFSGKNDMLEFIGLAKSNAISCY